MINREKYFYIGVPREDFHQVKHKFYNAPSTFLKVYDGDIIKHLNKQVEELQKALEDQKLRMQEGYKCGFESETIFWTRCIWEIDQAIERTKP